MVGSQERTHVHVCVLGAILEQSGISAFQILSQQSLGSPAPSPQHIQPPPAQCREGLNPVESVRGVQPHNKARSISSIFSHQPPLVEARLHPPSSLCHRGRFSLVFFSPSYEHVPLLLFPKSCLLHSSQPSSLPW